MYRHSHCLHDSSAPCAPIEYRSTITTMAEQENPVTEANLEAPGDRAVERLEKMETTLLREFRKWAIGFESRFRANEILVGGFNERMISLEERVSGLEQRG